MDTCGQDELRLRVRVPLLVPRGFFQRCQDEGAVCARKEAVVLSSEIAFLEIEACLVKFQRKALAAQEDLDAIFVY